MQKEVNVVISAHLNNKNYNVNDAQIWTNQICDDVLFPLSRSSRVSRRSTGTSSSSPIASSCRRPIADSTSRDPASGIMKSMAPSPSNGTHLPSSASSTSSDAHSDHTHPHTPNPIIIPPHLPLPARVDLESPLTYHTD